MAPEDDDLSTDDMDEDCFADCPFCEGNGCTECDGSGMYEML